MGKSTTYFATIPAPAFDMAKPNDGAPDRGMLSGICGPGDRNKNGCPPWIFHEAGRDPWLPADQLEELMDGDARLRRACSAALASLPPRPRTKDPELVARHEAKMRKLMRPIAKHVARVFEERMLVVLIERFRSATPLVAEYMLAKEAVRAVRPGKFPEPLATEEDDPDDDDDDDD